MTVIVGIVDKDGTIYMGGDSAATTNSGDQVIVENRKVFFPVHGPWFLLGFAGSFRYGQLLRYHFVPPTPLQPGEDVQHYMSTVFVDSLRECLEKNGFSAKNDLGREVNGFCVVGYQGRLYRIEDDFQVILDTLNFSALGSGEGFALGSLYASEGRKPEDRITVALEASCRFSAWCRPPFVIEKMDYSPDDWANFRRALKKTRKRKKK